MTTFRWNTVLAAVVALFVSASAVSAQVTTSSMAGRVTDEAGSALEGARVEAVHTPSGTRYAALTRADGRFTIPGMRVGGPYDVNVTRIGYQQQKRENVFLSLGTATDVSFKLSTVATTIGAVTVTGETGIISPTRTGAATAVAAPVRVGLMIPVSPVTVTAPIVVATVESLNETSVAVPSDRKTFSRFCCW